MSNRRTILKLLGSIPLAKDAATKVLATELGTPAVATALGIAATTMEPPDNHAVRTFGPPHSRRTRTMDDARKLAHEIVNEHVAPNCLGGYAGKDYPHQPLCDAVTSALLRARNDALEAALATIKPILIHHLWGRDGRSVWEDIQTKVRALDAQPLRQSGERGVRLGMSVPGQ